MLTQIEQRTETSLLVLAVDLPVEHAMQDTAHGRRLAQVEDRLPGRARLTEVLLELFGPGCSHCGA